jgi:hypothetical protein
MTLTDACRVPSLNVRKQLPPRLPPVTMTVCVGPGLAGSKFVPAYVVFAVAPKHVSAIFVKVPAYGAPPIR